MMAPNNKDGMDGKNMGDSYNICARHKCAEASYTGDVYYALQLLPDGHHYCLVYVYYPQACVRLMACLVMVAVNQVLNDLVTACLVTVVVGLALNVLAMVAAE